MDLVKIGLVDYGLGGRYFHVPLTAAADVLGAARVRIERRTTVRPGAER